MEHVAGGHRLSDTTIYGFATNLIGRGGFAINHGSADHERAFARDNRNNVDLSLVRFRSTVTFAADDQQSMIAPSGNAVETGLILIEFGCLRTGFDLRGSIHSEPFRVSGEAGSRQEQN